MLDMFVYNWQVREEWIEWCKTIPLKELRRERLGGIGSILRNLYHVIDCEQLWVNQILGTPVIITDINFVSSLEDVQEFSALTRPVTENLLKKWNDDFENRILEIKSQNENTYSFTYGKIIRHILSHEIHHVGQISIWSREIGVKPVSSDLFF